MRQKSPGWVLLVQALGIAGFAVFVSIIPLELVAAGAILWIPALIASEIGWARRYFFWPGFPLRVAVAGAIVMAAVLAPLKHEDRKLEALPGTEVTLEELSIPARIWFPHDRAKVRVTLPSNPPTLGQVISAIESQTDLICDVRRCGTGATILWGGYIIGIQAEPRVATAR